jgi:hypothetical protein
MKRSDMVTLALMGTVYGYSLFHHGAVYRDTYASREECMRDWGDAQSCEEERASSGGRTGRYYGPSYEEGARPATSEPGRAQGRSVIARGGFGRSGAHFTGAGG